MEIWLSYRALAASPEDPVPFPEPMCQPATIGNLISRAHSALMWPLLAPGTHVVHKYICR